MADVEVIIKIPEEDWKSLKESDGCRWSRSIIEGVINGTPLPKGHGRLKDIDEVERLLDLEKPDNAIAKALKNIIESIPTIIEADRKEQE